jgi:small neutral amino acid transporter SnatA (MarC family)
MIYNKYHIMKIISTATCILLSLNGCTILAHNLGAAASTVQIAQGADTLKIAADMVSTANSGKTITDHALSQAMDKDCNIFGVLKGKELCIDIKNPTPNLVDQ